MNCKACRNEIEESDGRQPFSVGTSAHLESCLNCRAFRDENTALKTLIDDLEVVSAPADFDFRLRARLATVRSDGRGHFNWDRFAPGAWSLAIAAAVVVIIGVGLMIRQGTIAPVASSGRQEVAKKNPVESVAPSSSPDTFTPKAGPFERRTQSSNLGVRDTITVSSPRHTGNGSDSRSKVDTNTASVDEEIHSRDFVSTPPANSVMPPGIPDPLTQPRSIVAVPVRTSLQPTTITLSDGRAKPQTVSIRPVTFGGQDVFEQENASKVIVPTIQGIW